MRFNSFKYRLLISLILATPSYTFLWAIRGYTFNQITLYAHVEYSTAVFFILIILFEAHNQKSVFLEKFFSWKTEMIKRFWLEVLITILITPVVVTAAMIVLYQTIWDMNVWFPGILEYNLFALSFSFLIAVFVNAEVIVEDWKRSILENEQLEKENTRAKLNALQAQISPHFLFNNFNVLNALIQENPDLAQRYLDILSQIYRYVLNYKDEELVNLSDEIEFIEKYLFLLQIRFGENLNWTIDIEKHKDAKIPPATLQLLVENAVKHNEISSRRPLHIFIEQTNKDQIDVRNNVQLKNGNHQSTSLGLNNVSNRFSFFTHIPVEIIKNEKVFIVKLPILKLN